MSRPICPSFDDTCPYCKRGFCCMQEMTGDTPEGQCDEYDTFNDEEDERAECDGRCLNCDYFDPYKGECSREEDI